MIQKIKKSLEQKNSYALGIFAALFIQLIYSGNFVISRYSLQNGLEAIDLVALRFLVSGFILLPFLHRMGWTSLGGLGWKRGTILTILAGFPYMITFYSGLQWAPASHGAVFNPGSVPLVVYLILIFRRHERFHSNKVFALSLIIVGMVLTTTAKFSSEPKVLLGDTLFFASAISWGLFTYFTLNWNVKPFQTATVISVLSLIFVPFYFIFLFDGFGAASWTHVALQGLLQGVINAIITLALLAYAIHQLGPQLAALFSPITPILTTVLGIWILSEVPNFSQWVGIISVGLGMLGFQWISKRERESTKPPFKE